MEEGFGFILVYEKREGEKVATKIAIILYCLSTVVQHLMHGNKFSPSERCKVTPGISSFLKWKCMFIINRH